MQPLKPPRVGVVGAGSFGKNHLRVTKLSPAAQLAGVFDIDDDRARAASLEFGCPTFETFSDFLRSIDAAIVAVPTSAHAAVAVPLLEAGIDLLVEKPIAATGGEARQIVAAAARHGRVLQVGHLERFNPAVLALESMNLRPLFFEIHRLSLFSPRSLDVDVVLDLMIHDLEIVMALTGETPEEIRAAGIRILSPHVDIANVRLQFPSGCVANLTASRASAEQTRKLRLFAPHRYLSLDYSRKEITSVRVGDKGQIHLEPVSIPKEEPLKLELEHFFECCRTRARPKVSGEEALQALEAALQILDKIQEHTAVVASSLGNR
jgi:predicted dehydrogenase